MVSRRSVVQSLAAAPLAVVLADPQLARAVAQSLQEVTTHTSSGKRVRAALARPDQTPSGSVLMVHEWWGLNDQIKAVAAELAREGYAALAVDLYDGRVATERDDARAYMQSVVAEEATQTLVAWADWLRAEPSGNGRLGTVGWCFGGGWSLRASLATPADATIVYYGDVARTAAELSRLKGPVLGHFATQDQWINRDMVADFERAMSTAGKTYESHWYDAEHAFANPTSARYDATDAELAWGRSLEFLHGHLS